MDPATADPGDASYAKIHFSGKFNWIRIKPGMEQAAAFLEKHRYAALIGGSMGFAKLEGTTVDAKDKVVYTAMSRIETSMVKGNALPRDVAVDRRISAGAVQALNLKGGRRDTSGVAIDSEWGAGGRLGIAAARQGQGHARSAGAGQLQGSLRRERRLSDRRADRDPARQGPNAPATRTICAPSETRFHPSRPPAVFTRRRPRRRVFLPAPRTLAAIVQRVDAAMGRSLRISSQIPIYGNLTVSAQCKKKAPRGPWRLKSSSHSEGRART